MIQFENYKSNLDFVDKHNLKDVRIMKSVICSNISLITKPKSDPKTKFSPIVAAVLGLDNTAASRYPSVSRRADFKTWTDIDSQQWFLDSKPTCYLVLSKPGAGGNSLAEVIAKKTNCVHLSPSNIIQDEIEQETPTGKALDYNMRHNGVCDIHIIMAILKKKMESAVVKHRGYVLSGFPLVTASSSPLYLFKTLDSEEAIIIAQDIIFDLVMHFKKKSKRKRAQSDRTSESSFNVGEGEEDLEEEHEEDHDEEVEEEEEQPVELPKYLLDQCSNIIDYQKCIFGTKKGLLHYQLKEIFNPKLKPDIVFNISCPDAALITKKMHKYFNYKSNVITFDPFVEFPDDNLRWPVKCPLSEYVKPVDHNEFQPKYNLRLPINFSNLSNEQMCNYKRYVLTYIENKIKDYNPKYVIKLDGRISIHEMAYQVTELTSSLPSIKPVLIPEPLYMEDIPDGMDEFWEFVEAWNVIRHESVKFNRSASPWNARCPVELKNRRCIVGKPKFAASFFRHVYLLSSLNNLIDFYKNPRPYLNLYNLEPTCRIAIMGTKSSGKSMISACISWIFGAHVIDFKTIERTEYNKKREAYSISILSKIITNIEDDRLEKWKIAEVDRMTKLNEWNTSTINDLKKYIILMREYTAALQQVGNERRIDKRLAFNYKNTKEKLLFLPFIDDIELCKDAIKERDLIMYGPVNLSRAAEKPTTPVIGDVDVTQAINDYIVANELQKEIDPSPEDLMAEIITTINKIDAEAQEQSNSEILYGKYVIDGMPSDPEYWNILSESKLLPDYTIAIIENRELESDMINRYIKLEPCIKNYQERFLLADDPLVQISIVTKQKTEQILVNIQMIVHDFIEEVFDSIFTESEEIKEMKNSYLASFNQEIEKFRENWDSVKLRLEENSKFVTEIDIEHKTDIEILEEVLLNIRKAYFPPIQNLEGEEDLEEEGSDPKNNIFYNHPNFLCETNTYCPIAFYDHRVLWEGKPEFSCKYGNKYHYFCKEECLELFKKDPSKYQGYNKPYKDIPPLRICIMGITGSGKSTLAKLISKELGIINVNFAEILNYYLMPRHVKKVGFEYENKFTDEPIEEETVVDFQMAEENENTGTEILSNETELRRMVFNYLERGTPLTPKLLHKVLRKLWDIEPFSGTGFILDGFPRTSSDVEEMIALFCVPDLVIELESNMELSIDRMVPGMLKRWKMQQNEAKAKAKNKIEKAQQDWNDFITKQVVVKLIMDDILEEVTVATADEITFIASVQSMIMDANPQGSANVDANLFNTYHEMIQDYPEPVDDTVWEKSDDAREMIESRIEGLIEMEDESIQNLKDILIEHRVKIIPIDATKSLNKVCKVLLSQLSIIRNRNMSLFEQTCVLPMDIAELLLSQGYYFMSKFNRMGPVYIYEHPKSIQNTYKTNKSKGTIYPVAHRSNIYFVNGNQALEKFRADPLKYIDSDEILSYHEFPLRIGIIGPPKSGKSAIAAKLAKKYGLVCITRGSAIRAVIEKMRWSKLASQILLDLHAGRCVDPTLIVNAILTVVNDHRSKTHGYVLDGFPEFTTVAKKLISVGLYPTILFDLQASKKKIFENSQKEIYYDIYKYCPPYSTSFIRNRYDLFVQISAPVRHYVKTEVQNLTEIDGNVSRWQCVQDIKKHIDEITPSIHHYLNHVSTNIVNVDMLSISPEIFEENQSCFKNHCPVCLSNNILRHRGCTADRKGIVQYKGLFYWICSEHMKKVMKFPDHFLNARYVDIPEVPAMVNTINLPSVYENGICIVTYAEHLPAQIFKAGLKEYAASFKGKTYMLCSELCLEKFLLKPLLYYDITVFKTPTTFPTLSLNKLPDIGYLEQVFGNILTDACCYVNVLRPKYPGLSVEVSGLIYVALYLKTRNYYLEDAVRNLYTKAYKKYETRSKLIIQLGLRLRSMDNPFASYPKCCDVKKADSGTVCKPSSEPKLPSQMYFANRSQDDLTFNTYFPEEV